MFNNMSITNWKNAHDFSPLGGDAAAWEAGVGGHGQLAM